MKKLVTAACALLGATALATPAEAQRVTRIVAFGDSFADTGNAFRLGLPPQAVYPANRFTNGYNYIDTLSTLTGAPQANFAIGGALTSNANTIPGLPGFTYEYTRFLAGGGTPFPSVSPTFGANDLLALSIGGNDARIYQSGGGTIAGAPTAAGTAVASVKTGLDALVNAGARNISYVAVNTALAPEIAGNANGIAVRNAYATSFNTGLQGLFAGYASRGVIVNYLDLATLGQEITANPAAYGLTSAGACPVASGAACVGPLGNQYLFYVDQLHLSQQGFAIVAQYIDAQLRAPLTLQAPREVGLATGRQFGRTLLAQLDAAAPRDGETADGVRFFVTGDGFTTKRRATDRNDQFNVNGAGATAGVEFGMGNSVVGIAGNYSRPKTDFGNDSATIHSRSWQVGAYAGTAIGPIFGEGYAGYGWDKHRVDRNGPVYDLAARPSGKHYEAGGKLGYLGGFMGLRAGPVLALDYAHARVDGYTETGDPALNLAVSRTRGSNLTGGAGLEVRGVIGDAAAAFHPFAQVMAEKRLSGSAGGVTYAQTASPTIVNSYGFANASKKVYARGTLGADVNLFANTALHAVVSNTFGRKDGSDLSGQVGFKLGF
ncbi:autotransporter domain-containing protein [Sphingomonas ginkgonis]|nr:autotransporter domain-containing protein [Sphingomonas ginkgonis]